MFQAAMEAALRKALVEQVEHAAPVLFRSELPGPSIIVGLYLHGGDGPMRFRVEHLHGSMTPRIVVDALNEALDRGWNGLQPVSCAWRWRCANALSAAYAAVKGGQRLEFRHTREAPVAYRNHVEAPGRRHYRRPYMPRTETDAKELRSLSRGTRRKARQWLDARQGHVAKHRATLRKAMRGRDLAWAARHDQATARILSRLPADELRAIVDEPDREYLQPGEYERRAAGAGR